MLRWLYLFVVVFFFKQKTAYEMRISDWSSDVCSSDLQRQRAPRRPVLGRAAAHPVRTPLPLRLRDDPRPDRAPGRPHPILALTANGTEHVSNWPLLSLVIWLPIIGGGLVLALGNQRANAARWLSLLIALATFLLSIPLFTGFDYANAGLQFIERREWIPAYDIQYHLGADGISIALILLTTITSVLVLIGAWGSVS